MKRIVDKDHTHKFRLQSRASQRTPLVGYLGHAAKKKGQKIGHLTTSIK